MQPLPSAEGDVTTFTAAEASDPLTTILTALTELRQDFTTKLMYDQIKDAQIDQLHRQVEEQRAGLHFRILRPVFHDLIMLYDDVVKMVEHDSQAGAAMPLYTYLTTSIMEILLRNGVEQYTIDGDMFTIGEQRAITTIPTSSSDQHDIIAQRLRPGFRYEGRSLRPEWVNVYRYVAAAPHQSGE